MTVFYDPLLKTFDDPDHTENNGKDEREDGERMTTTITPDRTPLRRAIVRVLKGQYMLLMFLVFGGGILFGHMLTPYLLLRDRLAGHDRQWNQRFYRGYVVLWLWLMEKGRLLKALPHKGKLMDGPCVLIANHPGLFDILIMIRDVPKMSLIAKHSLRTGLGMGYLFRLAGWVFATGRSDASMVLDTTNKALEQLKDGYKFMLFPEGTRSPKHGLNRFRAGAFKLARTAHVPVQPVVIRNTPPFLPHEDRWFYPPYDISIVQLEFLDPLPPPIEKEERRTAAEMEGRFRSTLNIKGEFETK